ncbi:hypothetical protein AVEN_9742-1, partial [Araneus ventricosus]
KRNELSCQLSSSLDDRDVVDIHDDISRCSHPLAVHQAVGPHRRLLRRGGSAEGEGRGRDSNSSCIFINGSSSRSPPVSRA